MNQKGLLMNIIPYEKYSFRCNLTVKEATVKLKDNIEQGKLFRFRFGGGTKIFQGEFYNNDFKISRIISYHNSFLPQIKGKIRSEGNTIIIDVKMLLHPFVIIFMCIWFSGVILGCAVSVLPFINNIIQGSTIPPGFFIPFVMLIFGIGLCTIPFSIEAKIAKNELAKIFNVYTE